MKDDLRTNCTSRFEHGEETKEQIDLDKLVEQVWHGDSPDEADVVAEKSIVPVKGVVGVGGVLCDQADPGRNVCRDCRIQGGILVFTLSHPRHSVKYFAQTKGTKISMLTGFEIFRF